MGSSRTVATPDRETHTITYQYAVHGGQEEVVKECITLLDQSNGVSELVLETSVLVKDIYYWLQATYIAREYVLIDRIVITFSDDVLAMWLIGKFLDIGYTTVYLPRDRSEHDPMVQKLNNMKLTKLPKVS